MYIYVIYDAGKSLLAAGTPGLKRYQHNFGKNSLPKPKTNKSFNKICAKNSFIRPNFFWLFAFC